MISSVSTVTAVIKDKTFVEKKSTKNCKTARLAQCPLVQSQIAASDRNQKKTDII